MTTDTIGKVVSLDSIYFLCCIFLLLLIKSDGNLLDIMYLFVVTFYYVRIKFHRKNHSL